MNKLIYLFFAQILCTQLSLAQKAPVIQWQYSIGAVNDFENAVDAVEFPKGNYVFLMDRNPTITDSSRNVILKLNSDGQLVGRKVLRSGSDNILAQKVIVSKGGNSLIVAGDSFRSQDQDDFSGAVYLNPSSVFKRCFLIELDQNLNRLKTIILSDGEGWISHLSQYGDHYYVISTAGDVWKLKSDFSLVWHKNLGLIFPQLTNDGRIYVGKAEKNISQSSTLGIGITSGTTSIETPLQKECNPNNGKLPDVKYVVFDTSFNLLKSHCLGLEPTPDSRVFYNYSITLEKDLHYINFSEGSLYPNIKEIFWGSGNVSNYKSSTLPYYSSEYSLKDVIVNQNSLIKVYSAKGSYISAPSWDLLLSENGLQNIILTSDGGYLLTGSKIIDPMKPDAWVVKLGPDSSICKTFDPFQDVTSACDSVLDLDAGAGYTDYLWSNSLLTQKIRVNKSGYYKVSVANSFGCNFSDSTYVNLLSDKIMPRDTSICKGATITLRLVNPSGSGANIKSISDLPQNLRLGLVAYYPFSGNANDIGLNLNHGTVFGAELAKDRFGNPNSSYYFKGYNNLTGTGDWIGVSNIVSLPKSGSPRTISFWANRVSIDDPSTPDATVFNFGNHVTQGGQVVSSQFICTYGLTRPYISNGPEKFCYDCSNTLNGTSQEIKLNQWYNVVITFQDFNAKVFVNGVLLFSGFVGSLFDNPLLSNFIIGRAASNTQYFKGYIDDIGIWNRVLSPSEIQQVSTARSVKWFDGSTGDSVDVLVNSTGKYYVDISDGYINCSDTITVNVISSDTTITALDNPSICSNSGSVRLQAGVSNLYIWLRNGLPINGANSRIYTASTSGDYRVVVGSVQGCTDTSRVISVIIEPKPVPNFTINKVNQCLSGNQFLFTNTSSISKGSMTYLWSFGNSKTTDSISPSMTYVADGVYNVKLVVTSDKACKDSLVKQVTVIKDPDVPTITSTSDEFCIGSSLVLTTNANPTIQWFRNNILISGATGSTLTVSQAGDYSVKTTLSSGCQASSVVKKIVENPTPDGVLEIPLNLVICEGFATKLTASGASSYQWYLNNVAIAGATNSTYDATQAGVYSVDFISDKGCIKRSVNSITLSLLKKPKASFTYNASCRLVPITFTSTSDIASSGSVQYRWDLGSGIIGTGSTYTYTFNSAGGITVKLVVTPVLCPLLADSISRNIQIENPPAGIVYPTINAVLNKPKPISARAIGVSYLWQPSTDLSNATIINPILTATAERFYKIFITNQSGCLTVDTQYVKIFKDRDIYVPKAFSPNGDGQNDRLYPIPVGIKEMTIFRVYTRWGNVVYDNKSATASTGWDGTFRGNKLPVGTYTWIAEGIDDDGNVIRRSGNTVLVR
jgi:gliding motility-associated-like protein